MFTDIVSLFISIEVIESGLFVNLHLPESSTPSPNKTSYNTNQPYCKWKQGNTLKGMLLEFNCISIRRLY